MYRNVCGFYRSHAGVSSWALQNPVDLQLAVQHCQRGERVRPALRGHVALQPFLGKGQECLQEENLIYKRAQRGHRLAGGRE